MQDAKVTNNIAVAYIPVLHKGYADFLQEAETRGAERLYLIGDDILETHEELDYIHRKDRIRAIEAGKMAEALAPLTTLAVSVLTVENAVALGEENVGVVTPSEDIGKVVIQKYFPNSEVEYVNIFLRFNRENVDKERKGDAPKTIKASEFQKKLFGDVLAEADKSFDWWRQVGAALVKGEDVLFITHNEHTPEKQLPNIIGDARSLFKRGININYVTTAHAEAGAIAEAAKRGIATEGAELYVTAFPCPYCARIIAKSGIKTVYFLTGYAVLDGDEFFKEEGVEVIQVEL
ncbi:hypothetical protein HY416_02415 [Candidatus Kaiserbacteria bacterium]|nr:hypothetical protein [Candidatus Kaiserbacteria bacterium]